VHPLEALLYKGVLVAAIATTAKLALGRHKREIVVTKDKTDIRTNYDYIKQLSRVRLEEHVLAV